MLLWKNDMKIPPQVEEEVDDRKRVLLFGPADGRKEKTTKEDLDKGIDREANVESAMGESRKMLVVYHYQIYAFKWHGGFSVIYSVSFSISLCVRLY